MSAQYIVTVMLDSTLNVSATGPFRTRAKAERVAEQINDASAWTGQGVDYATIIAQVVRLESVADMLEACRDRRGE